jgi:hypothetical protein
MNSAKPSAVVPARVVQRHAARRGRTGDAPFGGLNGGEGAVEVEEHGVDRAAWRGSGHAEHHTDRPFTDLSHSLGE